MSQNKSSAKDKANGRTEDAPVEATATKRVRLTETERIAKLEAELAAARKKAEEKTAKQHAELRTQREKLVAKRDELNTKIAAIDAALPAAEAVEDSAA